MQGASVRPLTALYAIVLCFERKRALIEGTDYTTLTILWKQI